MRPLLTGIRIIDLTSVVLGPYATQMLGDLGAEVIKVEAPGGDIMRAQGHARHTGMGPQYLNLNRNKRSVVLDLKKAEEREALLRLVEGADVFIHNLRPAAIQKLGLGYAVASARNPRLVYCATWGFIESGPYGNLPAYDDVVQGASGIAALNAVGGEPRHVPTLLADKVTGLHAVIAILAALLHRGETGKGQYVEVPMFECLVAFLMAEHLSGATFDPPMAPPGYARILSPFRRPFKAKDGYIAVLPYTTDHWTRFLRHIGRDDLARDEAVLDTHRRSQSADWLYGLIAEVAPSRTCAEWFAELKALEIPCMPVRSLSDLLVDEHLNAVSLFKRFTHPTEGSLLAVEHPVRFTGVDAVADRPAPTLGQDTDDVLGDLRGR
jgi:crotonobetainyl-CoA:carnitine CoA-transferase CaiB-like acyl-CoA transferase